MLRKMLRKLTIWTTFFLANSVKKVEIFIVSAFSHQRHTSARFGQLWLSFDDLLNFLGKMFREVLEMDVSCDFRRQNLSTDLDLRILDFTLAKTSKTQFDQFLLWSDKF